MKKIWTNRWKKALIWFSGYFSLIAFAIVGGYVIVKSEDDDRRKPKEFHAGPQEAGQSLGDLLKQKFEESENA